jgi:hypothetical protein
LAVTFRVRRLHREAITCPTLTRGIAPDKQQATRRAPTSRSHRWERITPKAGTHRRPAGVSAPVQRTGRDLGCPVVGAASARA